MVLVNTWQIIEGDCLSVMPTLAADSVDAIVSDPPYGLSFMGRDWDHGVPGEQFWREALRVTKPGAHLLAFGGTRTFHRLACAIEDAGWEIRDCIMWVYGSGFPKSLDVSKAIDREAGAVREKVRIPSAECRNPKATGAGRDGAEGATRPWIEEAMARGYHEKAGEVPATPDAAQWQGWGTALKPAWEPIIVARKPVVGTVAANVLRHGTGAINVDGCRVGTGGDKGEWPATDRRHCDVAFTLSPILTDNTMGRWPANLIHDGSEDVVRLFPESTSGTRAAGVRSGLGHNGADGDGGPAIVSSTGSAARFFYCAKASKTDRGATNRHPTVKPTDLMRYLCRLVTPPGGTILDPFAGSGSTGKGALLEGFSFIGIEREPEHAEEARKRLAAISPQAAVSAPPPPVAPAEPPSPAAPPPAEPPRPVAGASGPPTRAPRQPP